MGLHPRNGGRIGRGGRGGEGAFAAQVAEAPFGDPLRRQCLEGLGWENHGANLQVKQTQQQPFDTIALLWLLARFRNTQGR